MVIKALAAFAVRKISVLHLKPLKRSIEINSSNFFSANRICLSKLLGGIWEQGSFGYLPWQGGFGNLGELFPLFDLSPSFPQHVNTSMFICFFWLGLEKMRNYSVCQPFQCCVCPSAGIHIWHSHPREEGGAGGEVLQHRSRHRQQRGPRPHPCVCPGPSSGTAPNLRYGPSQLLLMEGHRKGFRMFSGIIIL